MIPGRPHRMLWSYHYAKTQNLSALLARMVHKPKLFADSGAFSALTQGAAIDVATYGDWLLEHRDHFEVYANLDVIGDAEATLANQRYLEGRGLRPLPVYHGGAPQRFLDAYADDGHSYIALGGTVGIGAPARMRWFLQAFKWARDRREAGKSAVVFHGFGVTTHALLKALPWYTVDSTSWNKAAKYGIFTLFDPTRGEMRQWAMRDKAKTLANEDLIIAYGGEVRPFLDPDLYKRVYAIQVQARSWRAFEEYCRARHGLQSFPETTVDDVVDRADGLHIYFADGAAENHALVNRALSDNEVLPCPLPIEPARASKP